MIFKIALKYKILEYCLNNTFKEIYKNFSTVKPSEFSYQIVKLNDKGDIKIVVEGFAETTLNGKVIEEIKRIHNVDMIKHVLDSLKYQYDSIKSGKLKV